MEIPQLFIHFPFEGTMNKIALKILTRVSFHFIWVNTWERD